MPSGKFLRPYYVGIGRDGIVMESHKVMAYNKQEAWSAAFRFLERSKDFNYIYVQPVKVMKA